MNEQEKSSIETALNILVIDDDRRMARTLVDILRVKGFEATAAHDAEDALAKVKQNGYDLVLSDIRMPGTNGVELYRTLKTIRPEMPVVLMTAYSSDSLVNEGLAEGVIASLQKPLDINNVLAFISSLRKEKSVVIVDDEIRFGKMLKSLLESRGFSAIHITEPDTAVEFINDDAGIVLLDMHMPGDDGLAVLKKLRSRFPALPVILITGYGEQMAEAVETALEIKAHACLYKPFEIDELLRTIADARRERFRDSIRR